MKSTIEHIPRLRIAYLRQIGPYGSGNVQTMEKLKNWARFNNLFDNRSIILGIAQDNPATKNPENCRYDTCIVVADDYSFEEGDIKEGLLQGGKHVVFQIDHTAEAVQNAWSEIFPGLFGQGLQFDESRPILERYRVEMVNNHSCEICVPIF
jgi:DNA gyrase inhibitor GyrI